MEYLPCVMWYLNIESKTIKQRPTLTQFMQFWDFWWVSSVQDEIQCGLGNCNECDNYIETSRHWNTGIPFTLWLVFPYDMAVSSITWRSRGWDCDGNARCQGTVFHCEEFNACHLDWRPGRSTGCRTPDDPNFKALENMEVVRIKTHESETTFSDTQQEYTCCSSRMDWETAS